MSRNLALDAASLATGENATVAAGLRAKGGPARPREQDIDRHLGARVRERRIELGLTQQQATELVGIAAHHSQWNRYEDGLTGSWRHGCSTSPVCLGWR